MALPGHGHRWAGAALAALCAAALLVVLAMPARAMEDDWRIYIDADFTHSPTVGRSIELGVRAALSHHGMADRISVLVQDHRGNSRRSLDTLKTAALDPRAIAVVGGMHSPPYLSYNLDINALGIPILLPWSSSAPITRSSPAARNWMFRIAVDNRVALPYLVRDAEARRCRSVARLVVDTPWGLGVALGLGDAIARHGLEDAGLWRIPVGGGSAVAARIAARLGEVDCVFLAADSHAAAAILAELAALPRPPAVLSHWDIFGAPDLYDRLRVPLSRLDLRILGTCVLERLESPGEIDPNLLASARAFAGVNTLGAIEVPHAFSHAFDAVSLLVGAASAAQETRAFGQGIERRRGAIRGALYALPAPVRGLVKTYDQPFSPFSPANPDGHEAIGREDLCLNRLDAMGRLRPSLAAAPDRSAPGGSHSQ